MESVSFPLFVCQRNSNNYKLFEQIKLFELIFYSNLLLNRNFYIKSLVCAAYIFPTNCQEIRLEIVVFRRGVVKHAFSCSHHLGILQNVELPISDQFFSHTQKHKRLGM